MKFKNDDVKAVFEQFPDTERKALQDLRARIFDVAKATHGVGELEETLKWGEPAYLTANSKSGTTIRICTVRNRPGHVAMYVNCKTTLLDSFRALYPDEFKFDGGRALIFDAAEKLPDAPLDHCIAMALTYHLLKRQR
jgi:hypothetical protein